MPYTIHGLECDFDAGDGGSWPSRDCDFGVVDFSQRSADRGGEPEDSPRRYMVTLPGGVGLGATFEAALRDAAEDQHAAIWGEP